MRFVISLWVLIVTIPIYINANHSFSKSHPSLFALSPFSLNFFLCNLTLPIMADSNPFFPASQNTYFPIPDGTQPTGSPPSQRRLLRKIILPAVSGILLVVLAVALINSPAESPKIVRPEEGENVVSLSETAKPEILRPSSRGVSAGVSEKVNLIAVDSRTPAYPWNNSMLSWQRTAFHFQPEKNWMNGTLFDFNFIYLLNNLYKNVNANVIDILIKLSYLLFI